jgi:hypothetical protein
MKERIFILNGWESKNQYDTISCLLKRIAELMEDNDDNDRIIDPESLLSLELVIEKPQIKH